MDQVNIVEILLKEKDNNPLKKEFKEYEKELDNICCKSIIPLLKENITNDKTMPLLYKGLQTFDENGNQKSNLSDKEKILNDVVYKACVGLSCQYNSMLEYNLKLESIVDVLLNKELEDVEIFINNSYNSRIDMLKDK